MTETEAVRPDSTTGLPGDPAVTKLNVVASELDGIEDLPLPDAAARFDSVHAHLQAALAELDTA